MANFVRQPRATRRTNNSSRKDLTKKSKPKDEAQLPARLDNAKQVLHDGVLSHNQVLQLQRTAGNQVVLNLLKSAETKSNPEPTHLLRQHPRTDPGLAAQLRERANTLERRSNTEMNVLQNQLGIVANILDTEQLSSFSFTRYFRDRLISEGLEAIPFAPVAEGLKIAYDVYAKYASTERANSLRSYYNSLQTFTATKYSDLSNIQDAQLELISAMNDAADSGNEQQIRAMLAIQTDPRPVSDIRREGIAYRLGLNYAFLSQFVTMRTMIYDPARLTTEVLGPISFEAIRGRIAGEGPQYNVSAFMARDSNGDPAGGWTLRRWMTPTSEHMRHLTYPIADGGCGLDYDSLYYWCRMNLPRSEVKYAGETQSNYPQYELNWLFS